METERQTNDTDLYIFLLYIEDLTTKKGISRYRMLIDANMPRNFVQQIDRYLRGKKEFRKTINLSLLIHISKTFDFPFDMGKYLPLLPELRQKYNKQD